MINQMESLSLWHSTLASWLHTPVWVGEIHAQQDALLFVADGADDDQISDSDRADGLQLHRLRERGSIMRQMSATETEVKKTYCCSLCSLV